MVSRRVEASWPEARADGSGRLSQPSGTPRAAGGTWPTRRGGVVPAASAWRNRPSAQASSCCTEPSWAGTAAQRAERVRLMTPHEPVASRVAPLRGSGTGAGVPGAHKRVPRRHSETGTSPAFARHCCGRAERDRTRARAGSSPSPGPRPTVGGAGDGRRWHGGVLESRSPIEIPVPANSSQRFAVQRVQIPFAVGIVATTTTPPRSTHSVSSARSPAVNASDGDSGPRPVGRVAPDSARIGAGQMGVKAAILDGVGPRRATLDGAVQQRGPDSARRGQDAAGLLLSAREQGGQRTGDRRR